MKLGTVTMFVLAALIFFCSTVQLVQGQLTCAQCIGTDDSSLINQPLSTLITINAGGQTIKIGGTAIQATDKIGSDCGKQPNSQANPATACTSSEQCITAIVVKNNAKPKIPLYIRGCVPKTSCPTNTWATAKDTAAYSIINPECCLNNRIPDINGCNSFANVCFQGITAEGSDIGKPLSTYLSTILGSSFFTRIKPNPTVDLTWTTAAASAQQYQICQHIGACYYADMTAPSGGKIIMRGCIPFEACPASIGTVKGSTKLGKMGCCNENGCNIDASTSRVYDQVTSPAPIKCYQCVGSSNVAVGTALKDNIWMSNKPWGIALGRPQQTVTSSCQAAISAADKQTQCLAYGSKCIIAQYKQPSSGKLVHIRGCTSGTECPAQLGVTINGYQQIWGSMKCCSKDGCNKDFKTAVTSAATTINRSVYMELIICIVGCLMMYNRMM